MVSAGRTHLPPSFNRLAWSNLAAQSAEQIALAAAPIVTVIALGGGAGETGLIQTAQTLPFLVFAIPAGMLVDRMSRRNVMAYAEAPRVASLIAILALESHRNHSVVIGEDLGTVPEDVRLAMERYHLYHYKVVLFEREANGRFKPPGEYVSHALATVTADGGPALPVSRRS